MNFEIYSIQFHKHKASTDKGKVDYSKEIADFKSYFHKKINAYVVDPHKQGEPIIYDNRVFSQLDGNIILMRLCNNKKVSKVINYTVQKEDTYPFCTILFDLREESMILAIQRSSAFDNDTDKVRDLLQEFLRNIIDGRRGYNVTFANKIKILDFWKFIDQRTRKQDIIKRVEFNFPNERKDKIKADDDLLAHLRFFRSIGATLNAANEQMRYETGGCLRLEKTDEDLRRLVDLCVNNSYDITVHFRDFGVCRSTTDMRHAIFTLRNEKHLDDYIRGESIISDDSDIPTFAITLWLSNVVKDLEENDIESIE